MILAGFRFFFAMAFFLVISNARCFKAQGEEPRGNRNQQFEIERTGQRDLNVNLSFDCSNTYWSAARLSSNSFDEPIKISSVHPTFSINLKSPPSTLGEFSLFDESGNGIFQTTIAFDKRTQRVIIKLPLNVQLQVNKHYVWKVALICNESDRVMYDRVVHQWFIIQKDKAP